MFHVIMRSVLSFGAQISPHFLARDVDPRKDHPKDAGHPNLANDSYCGPD